MSLTSSTNASVLAWKVAAFCLVTVAWIVQSILAVLDQPLFPGQALALSATLRQVHTKAVQLSLLPEYHQRLLRAISDSATCRQNADGEMLDRAASVSKIPSEIICYLPD
jgi:hypothetical protein